MPNKPKMTELGCMWKKASKAGEKYLSGVLKRDAINAIATDGDISIVVFSNKGKTEEKHPDLRIYLSSPLGSAAAASPRRAAAPAPAPRRQAAAPAPAPAPDQDLI